jgi:hypothetical protein
VSSELGIYRHEQKNFDLRLYEPSFRAENHACGRPCVTRTPYELRRRRLCEMWLSSMNPPNCQDRTVIGRVGCKECINVCIRPGTLMVGDVEEFQRTVFDHWEELALATERVYQPLCPDKLGRTGIGPCRSMGCWLRACIRSADIIPLGFRRQPIFPKDV